VTSILVTFVTSLVSVTASVGPIPSEHGAQAVHSNLNVPNKKPSSQGWVFFIVMKLPVTIRAQHDTLFNFFVRFSKHLGTN